MRKLLTFSVTFGYGIGYGLIKVTWNFLLQTAICVHCALMLSTHSRWIAAVNSYLNAGLTKRGRAVSAIQIRWRGMSMLSLL